MENAWAEAVRVAERVVDHQAKAILAERADLERLMRLGIASLAGTLGGTGLLVQTGATIASLTVWLLGVGTMLQTAATAVATGGPRLDVTVGPTPATLYRRMAEGNPDGLNGLRLALGGLGIPP